MAGVKWETLLFKVIMIYCSRTIAKINKRVTLFLMCKPAVLAGNTQHVLPCYWYLSCLSTLFNKRNKTGDKCPSTEVVYI